MNDFWAGRPVLVTGASGIVGSWLVKALLERRAHVVALVRDADPQSELLRSGDIARVAVVNGAVEELWTLERAINEHEVEAVFHLAAQPLVGVAQRLPFATWEANVRGTYTLLEACRLHRALVGRVVVASSDKAYGVQERLPYREDMPLQGREPYEASKSCADVIAQSYAHAFGLPVAIARCGNVYGGGDLNWSRIVPGTIRSLLAGQRPVVRSDGHFRRDYVYVKDAVAAYLRLAEALDDEALRGEAFNFGPDEPATVLEVVAALQRLLGREGLPPVVLDAARGEIRDQYLDSTKAARTLGWAPRYALEEGLAETVSWYRAFLCERTLALAA